MATRSGWIPSFSIRPCTVVPFGMVWGSPFRAISIVGLTGGSMPNYSQ